MNDERVVQKVTFDPLTWTYSLHVVRYGGPVSDIWYEHCKHRGAEVESRWQDADMPHIHHLTLRWPVREARLLDYGTLLRLCVVWGLTARQRLTLAVQDAAQEHMEAFGSFPVLGFIHHLPNGIQEPAEVEIGEGIDPVSLVQADWLPEKFVVVFR